jgi:hypothetical protein
MTVGGCVAQSTLLPLPCLRSCALAQTAARTARHGHTKRLLPKYFLGDDVFNPYLGEHQQGSIALERRK